MNLKTVLSWTLSMSIGLAFSQNVGIGENNPGSKLSVNGGLAVGESYATKSTPDGTAIIERKLGIGTATINRSAVLDIQSSGKGVLLPRMTKTQREAISSPAKGLMVFDTDSNTIFFSNGAQWFNFPAVDLANATTVGLNADILNSWTGGRSAGLPDGTARGNTPYWDGSQWVVSSGNIYNEGADVGIGTSSPNRRLDIKGSDYNGLVGITNQNKNGYSSIDFYSSNGTMMGNIGYANSQAGSYAGDLYLATNNPTDMVFAIDNDEKMRLDRYGKVGIGTTSPDYLLDVNGTARVNGALTVGSYTLPSADGSAGQLLASDGNGNVSWQDAPSSGGGGATFATGSIAVSNNQTYNNLNIGSNTYIRLTGSNNRITITGIKNGSPGKMIILYSTSKGDIKLETEDSRSSSSNRIITSSSGSVTVEKGAAMLLYDGTVNRWILLNESYEDD